MTQYYEVLLLRRFVAGARSNNPTTYAKGSIQFAWQDRHGFIWLRGRETGWDFAACSKPGVDFVWLSVVDWRTDDMKAKAREFPAAVGVSENEEQVEKLVEKKPAMVSILLDDLRILQAIAGQNKLGGKREKERSEMLDRIGNIYEQAFIAERQREVIVPDMSAISLDIPGDELRKDFERGSQAVMLLSIRERLQTNDFNGFKKDGREKLIAEIDKVL